MTLLEAYGEAGDAPEILLFGDSTSVLASPFDLSRQTLATMVSRKMRPWRTLPIARVAYHPGVYSALLGALATMPKRPTAIVIPVNIRHFGPEWSRNPNTSHTELIEAVEAYVADPSAPIRTVPPLPAGNLLLPAPDTEAWEQFLTSPVSHPDRSERTVGDYVAVLTEAHTEDERLSWFQTIFAFQFLFSIPPESERLRSLTLAIERAQALGSNVFVYLVPANHEAGIELLGDAFNDALTTNTTTVINAVRAASGDSGSVVVEDWTRLLTPDAFFIRYDVLSHINERGRRQLAARVAESLRAVLRDRGAPTP